MNFGKKIFKIGFIGVGNMASAIISGITAGGYPTDKIFLYDLLSQKTVAFAEKGAVVVNSEEEIYDNCDCIVLAVKPQNYPEVIDKLANYSKGEDKQTLYISIAAGITTDTVSKALNGAPVVRALPNTPMLIGQGVTVLCRNELVKDSDFDFACAVFSSAGEIFVIDESEMNRIISVTSSSPAYVFKFIKAICDGADAQGLDGKALLCSVCAVVSGAAQQLAKSGKTPDELVAMVCSKGGTTERAVAELDNFSFEHGIVSAMKKCTARADELSEIKK